MIFNIAFVKWVDSTYYKMDYIDSINDIPKINPKVLISCGILISEDEDSITIAQDIVEEHDAKRLVLSIPKVSVISYETKKINAKELDKKK